jgi:NADH-quinone oxidoreductase subunit H
MADLLINQLINVVNKLIGWVGLSWLLRVPELPDWLAWSVTAVVTAVLILNVIAGGALVFIWAERKIAARIQDRLGPTRTGGRFGWLQSLADGIKLLAKEDLMPEGADGMLFKLAPYVSFCASFCAFIALPFAFDFVGQRLNVGVFFVVAVLGLEVFGVILAGYASASKWSLFGAMREAAQVVSYEVPLGMCVVVPVMLRLPKLWTRPLVVRVRFPLTAMSLR